MRFIISYRIRLLAVAVATSCSDSLHAAKPIPMHELWPGKLHFHWMYLALQTRRQHLGLRRRPPVSHLQLQLDLHLHPRYLVLQTQGYGLRVRTSAMAPQGTPDVLPDVKLLM